MQSTQEFISLCQSLQNDFYTDPSSCCGFHRNQLVEICKSVSYIQKGLVGTSTYIFQKGPYSMLGISDFILFSVSFFKIQTL